MTTSAIRLTRMEKRRTLGLIAVGHGVAHWYNGILAVLYPALTVALGLSYSQVGLFDSTRGIVAVIVSLAGGYMADTLGRRRLFLGLCLISLGIFTSLLSFAGTFLVALIWLGIGGVGNSLWHPYALPLLNSIFPKRRGLAIALHDAAANSFHGLAPIVVGLLLGMFSWQFVTRLHLWPGLVMGILILLTMPQVEKSRPERKTQVDYRQAWQSGILQNRQFLMASGISACLTMARLGLFTFFPLFLAFELGLNSASQGLYIGVMAFSGALLAPGLGSLADRIGLQVVLSTAIFIAGIVVISLVFAQSGVLLFGIVALLGGGLFSTRSLILVYVMKVTPKEMGGSSIGAIFSLNRFFGILSPIIAGTIADTFGLRFVFYFVSILLFVGVFLILMMHHTTSPEAT